MDAPIGGLEANDFSKATGSVSSYSELQKLAAKSKTITKELKAERRKAFHEGVLDCLADAAAIHSNILKTGVKLTAKAEQGKILSDSELELVKLAQKSAKEVTDRGIGKAVTRHEESHSVSFLSIIADASSRQQVLNSAEVIDVHSEEVE